MKQKIVVDPVTRIEGHAELDIITDDAGVVEEARFSVKSFRGFEKFLEGAPMELLPPTTARICGICYTSHVLASCKALENALNIEITPEARKLREILHLGNFIESHALSIAALSLPDLLFHKNGPHERNLAFLLKQREFLVRRAMKLRQAGSLITRFAGKRQVHPISPVIGGVLQPLNTEERDEIATMMEGAKDTVSAMWQLIWEAFHDYEDIAMLGETRSAFLSMKGREGVELYDADLAIMSENGELIQEFPPSRYLDFVEEEERDFSYMKFPVLKNGTKFRVGPLARLNICRKFPTPNSQWMMNAITSEYALPLQNSMLYHPARVAETMYAIERAEQLLNDEDLLSDKVKPEVCKAKEGRGIGIVEAPRGTLVHIYDIDSHGYAKSIALYVATQHNNFAMNDALTNTAKRIITGPSPEETTLNKLEMIIRAYDPCLSCATHTIGQREFRINLRKQDGSLIKRWE